MTQEELIETLSSSLNESMARQIGETLPELLKQVENTSEAVADKNRDIATLEARLAKAEAKITETEFARTKAEEVAKEQAWVASELGKFVSDIANGFYEGEARAAAQRVYDLNGGSLKKQRINASNFETLEDAESAFARVRNGEKYNSEELLRWLFEFASKE